MCESCHTINQVVVGILADLDDALDACDTDEVTALLDELQTLIGIEAVQPLLRSIIGAAVTHIGVHHDVTPVGWAPVQLN